jgi:purine-binding chemotaxis protein CheW
MANKKIIDMRQFVTFFVGDDLFGFDIRIVKEITQAVSITPVPMRDKEISGVVNIRGLVVLVMDIGVILDGSATGADGDDRQIVILKTGREIAAVADFKPSFDAGSLDRRPIGFVIETVGDIISVEARCIETAPSHIGAAHASFVDGVVRLEQRPLIILNAGKITEISKSEGS